MITSGAFEGLDAGGAHPDVAHLPDVPPISTIARLYRPSKHQIRPDTVVHDPLQAEADAHAQRAPNTMVNSTGLKARRRQRDAQALQQQHQVVRQRCDVKDAGAPARQAAPRGSKHFAAQDQADGACGPERNHY